MARVRKAVLQALKACAVASSDLGENAVHVLYVDFIGSGRHHLLRLSTHVLQLGPGDVGHCGLLLLLSTADANESRAVLGPAPLGVP